MKRTYAFANAAVASLVLSLVQCSSESTNTDDVEEGGAAGVAAGKGGSGKGGSGGSSAGSAGKAGSSGNGGSAAGSGGSSGSGAGTAGADGANGGAAGADAGAAGEAGALGGEAGAAAGEAGAFGQGTGGGGENTGGVPSDGGTAGAPSNEGGGGAQGGSDNPGGAGSGGSGDDPGIEGDRCETAPVITAGVLEDQSTAGLTHDYGLGACFNYGTSGPDRVYEIVIPAANRLDVEVTPLDDFDPAVALIPAPEENCVAAPECLTQGDVGFGGVAETVSLANDTAEARSVYVLVDGFGRQPLGGVFELDVAIAPTPIGDICQNPLALGEGTEIAGSLAAEGIHDDYSMDPCFEDPYPTIGPDVAYRIQLVAGSTLTVTVDPSDDLDVAVFFQIAQGSTCNRATCLGGSDAGAAGDDETVTYTNGSAATQTVYVIVDSFEPELSTPGPFHLDVNITP